MKLRKNSNRGFTMIELLMVILLVAILGAVALPQFLDFRTEGKVAAATQLGASIRTGIKLQYSQMILRCSSNNGSWPTFRQRRLGSCAEFTLGRADHGSGSDLLRLSSLPADGTGLCGFAESGELVGELCPWPGFLADDFVAGGLAAGAACSLASGAATDEGHIAGDRRVPARSGSGRNCRSGIVRHRD